jgi:hypothetical protein
MDCLHENGVEIVSPNFMNTRSLRSDEAVIPVCPTREVEAEVASESSPEATVSDKADEAESSEKLRLRHDRLTEEIERQEGRVEESPEGAEREAAERELSRLQRREERLAQIISARESASKDNA